MCILPREQDLYNIDTINKQHGYIFPITEKSSSSKKRVRFAPASNNTTHEIDAIEKQYSRSVWYSRAELQFIKSKRCMVAKQLKSGKLIEGIDDTYRGLERVLDARLSNFRYQMKANTMRAVLEEQHTQREQYGKIINTEMLSFVYQMNGSEQCHQVASIIGQQDFEKSISDNADVSEYISRADDSHQFIATSPCRLTKLKSRENQKEIYATCA